MVTTDVNVPRGLDPNLVLRIGREVAISCLYTHLGRPISVDLEDHDPRHNAVKLSIEAYVYDHRYESAMRTDILRRSYHEFTFYNVSSLPDHHMSVSQIRQAS
jgi:hypothetical protein